MRAYTLLLVVCVAGTALAWSPYRMRASVRDQELELEALLNAYLRSTDPTVVHSPDGSNPDENKPEGSKPDETKPGVSKPEGHKPDESQQGANKPAGVKAPEVMQSGVSQPGVEKPEKDEDEDSDSGDHDLDCSSVQPPCSDLDTKDDGAEFYECAFRELMNAEDSINDLVKDTFKDKGVFNDKEMEIVRDIRSDWKVSMKLKEVVEIVFMELAEARLYEYDWEKADSDNAHQIQAMICEYLWLRDQTFEKGVFHEEQ